MHEFSVANTLIETVLNMVAKYDVQSVKEVIVEIGELTMLSKEQLKFAYQVLCAEHSILIGSKIQIVSVDAVIRCTACDYTGAPERLNVKNHFAIPVILCPLCKKSAELVRGRECNLKDIILTVR
jgi:hydrogenase nickel insertion protein HypA